MPRMFWREGRHVRPPRGAIAVLLLVLGGAAAAGVLFYRVATRSYDPARTLAASSVLLREPIPLNDALGVEWRTALGRAGESAGSWQTLLRPPVPPAICPSTPESDPLMAGLAAAVRDLDAAIRRDAGAEEVQRRLRAMSALAGSAPGSEAEFVQRYNVARGYLALGDPATAAQIAEPLFDGYLERGRLPITTAARAELMAREEQLPARIAALGFHARFLAGTAAYRREEWTDAVKHFRFSLNAVNYLAAAPEGGMPEPARYRRVPVDAGNGCVGVSDAPLTSLDAYAALVASYMEAPEFTDPTRLGGEVRRAGLQMDADDPLRPVLRHAALTTRERGAPIPEHLIWAASNLQRAYHYNRASPDARLEVTRAALLLRLTGEPEWVEAMAGSGGADVCAMLAGAAVQLERQSRPLRPGGVAAFTDSARAAVGLHALARMESECGRDRLPPIREEIRSAWLRLGRATPGVDLPGRHEEWRLALEEALRPGSATEEVVAGRVAPVLERAERNARALRRRGSSNGTAPAGADARDDRFAEAWRRAVFTEAANALADAGSSATGGGTRTLELSGAGLGGGRTVEIPPGRAVHYLAALNSAIAHAGMHPDQVYAASELDRIARAAGRTTRLHYRLTYGVRSHPGAAIAVLAALFAAFAVAAVLLHVAWWRYHLLSSSRFYAAESRRRGRTGAAK